MNVMNVVAVCISASGLCLMAAPIPHIDQLIEFNLVHDTSLGMVWEAPPQGNKKFHHPGNADLVVYNVWEESKVYASGKGGKQKSLERALSRCMPCLILFF